MYAYCLQCVSHRCAAIAQVLELKKIGRAFSPQILQHHEKNGAIVKGYYDLLPGYVFLYSEEPLNLYVKLQGIDGIIRTLGYEKFGGALRGRDHDFAMSLYETGGRVEGLTAIREGDWAQVQSSLFSAYEGRVDKIDFRKQRARMIFTFDGQERVIWVACDILTKVRKKEEAS